MKILQVNKFHYPRGGADKYFLNLSQALRDKGHEVAVFSMHHPLNQASQWSKYFVSRLSFNEADLKDKLKMPGRIIYSQAARRQFKKLIKDFKPDIVHYHNIYHQLSPSILSVAKEQGIKSVIHLHDYKLICPNYQLFTKGQVCQACRPKKYYHCLTKKCFKNSYLKSALASTEMYLHHSIFNLYQKNLDYLISPSQFLKDKFIDFGWPAEKIKVITNPFDPSLKKLDNLPEENYLLYFGRLSQEKGIATLLQAASQTNSQLKILGEGPLEADLKSQAAKLKVSVDWLGFKQGRELELIINQARAVVIPSIWWENMPLNLLEALSLGKIVIAAKTGGIPEIINDQKNGLLFKAGDVQDLVAKIKSLDSLDLIAIKEEAKNSVANFNPANNLQAVISLYQELLAS